MLAAPRESTVFPASTRVKRRRDSDSEAMFDGNTEKNSDDQPMDEDDTDVQASVVPKRLRQEGTGPQSDSSRVSNIYCVDNQQSDAGLRSLTNALTVAVKVQVSITAHAYLTIL